MAALKENASYRRDHILGFPGSLLDRRVFHDAPFLESSPFLSCFQENPNHIGCHSMAQSESAFGGTQSLEMDLLQICAEEILGASADSWDGYVASGGTEANIQALWINRNYYLEKPKTKSNEIAVLHSEDTHYSVSKGCDLLGLRNIPLKVDETSRQILCQEIISEVQKAQNEGTKFFIVVLNMGTTMFGSVDKIAPLIQILDQMQANYRIHVDAAFGGFIYTFMNPDNELSFKNGKIVSFALDAHKMLQAPYGTGIFLVRKGNMEHVCTETATYVRGNDYTLCGSRSGANAVAAWMILRSYGSEGGKRFLKRIIRFTDHLCQGLDDLGVSYFRDPFMNIVTLRAEAIPKSLARRFWLVPDNHEHPTRWKIVVMDHFTRQILDKFLEELRTTTGVGFGESSLGVKKGKNRIAKSCHIF